MSREQTKALRVMRGAPTVDCTTDAASELLRIAICATFQVVLLGGEIVRDNCRVRARVRAKVGVWRRKLCTAARLTNGEEERAHDEHVDAEDFKHLGARVQRLLVLGLGEELSRVTHEEQASDSARARVAHGAHSRPHPKQK